MKISGSQLPFLLALLVPFAGLYLLPYLLMLGVGAVLLGGRSWIAGVLAVWLGMGLGCMALIGMHFLLDTYPYFMDFTRGQAGASVLDKLLQLPRAWLADPSLVPLVGFLVLVGILHCWEKRECPVRLTGDGIRVSVWMIGIVAAAVIPSGMTIAGKYPRYYSWMTFVPVLACTLYELDRRRLRRGDNVREK